MLCWCGSSLRTGVRIFSARRTRKRCRALALEVTYFVSIPVIRIIQLILDLVCVALVRAVGWSSVLRRWRRLQHLFGNLDASGRDTWEGVRPAEVEWYDREHARGYGYMLRPTGAAELKTAIVFIHGGGWVACGPILLVPSITPYARAGFPTYVIAYPLSPQSKFPVALRAVLLSIAHIQSLGFSRVVIMGESAGGNLATMAAAVLSNPRLADVLQEASPSLDFSFCRGLRVSVLAVISLYGILDRTSWTLDSTLKEVAGQQSWVSVSSMSAFLRLHSAHEPLCPASSSVSVSVSTPPASL